MPMEQQAFSKLNEQKRTQRMKNLMLWGDIKKRKQTYLQEKR
jgi:uncharacterized NAD(P)/FAD-binding protein YdhS